MNQIDTVWELTQEFVKNSTMVTTNAEKIRSVAMEIDKIANRRVDTLLPDGVSLKGAPPPDEHLRKMFLYELIANSVNYCFWYGRHNIRPNGASSTKMYKLLDESFLHLEELKKEATFDSRQELEIIVNGFIDKLCRARFPLMNYRVKHLSEILNRSDLLSVIDIEVQRDNYNVEDWLDYLITSFPGYATDLFLKRAFLFIIQMYRRCGLFKDGMSKILVPADYHIPKMLRWLGCITYNPELSFIVDSNVMIVSGCYVECEIRAATIAACQDIANLADCTCEEVDTYLFARRHECTDPFHLTVTAAY